MNRSRRCYEKLKTISNISNDCSKKIDMYYMKIKIVMTILNRLKLKKCKDLCASMPWNKKRTQIISISGTEDGGMNISSTSRDIGKQMKLQRYTGYAKRKMSGCLTSTLEYLIIKSLNTIDTSRLHSYTTIKEVDHNHRCIISNIISLNAVAKL